MIEGVKPPKLSWNWVIYNLFPYSYVEWYSLINYMFPNVFHCCFLSMVSRKICMCKWNTVWFFLKLDLNQVNITWRKPWNTIACCHCWHKFKVAKKGCMGKYSSSLPSLLSVTWMWLQCLLTKGLEKDLELCFNGSQQELSPTVGRILRLPSFIIP